MEGVRDERVLTKTSFKQARCSQLVSAHAKRSPHQTTMFQCSKLANEDIVNNWMDREVYEEINDHLAFTLAEQIFVREDSDIVDIPSSAKAAGIKLNGRDALTLLFEGGGEMLIRMLAVHRHGCLLQNHEACDKLIQQLTHNETFFNTKADEKCMLF